MSRVLITGCSGEVGHSLIDMLVASGRDEIVGVDLRPLNHRLPAGANVQHHQLDITDSSAMQALGEKYQFERIFHLAAILSTGGELDPIRAHEVNVDGSLNLLTLARSQAEKRNAPVRFIFPSTIAVYGIPSEREKQAAGSVSEDQFLSPITMYGNNKLYVEKIGRYFQNYYRFLDAKEVRDRVDFRSVRLPGVISAFTEPTGGTSDYGPEMLHAAAKNVPYSCFVEREARLPFMAMPDAVRAIMVLAEAPKEKLTRLVYNITALSMSAEEIRAEVLKYFPNAKIDYSINAKRNSIVSSWPGDVDDTHARRDWGWKPQYDKERAFRDYLIPAIRGKYENVEVRKAATS